MLNLPFSFFKVFWYIFDGIVESAKADSIPIKPGVEFTSIKYGLPFSLFLAGIKSTPTISPSTASAAYIDSIISKSVSSCTSGSEPWETLLLKSPSIMGLFIAPIISPPTTITLTS